MRFHPSSACLSAVPDRIQELVPDVDDATDDKNHISRDSVVADLLQGSSTNADAKRRLGETIRNVGSTASRPACGRPGFDSRWCPARIFRPVSSF